MTLFAVATLGPAVAPLLWVAIGVTAYGAAYLFVHEVVHPPAAAGAAARASPTSTGCVTPTGCTTATGASPTGCWCRSCRG